MFLSIYYDMLFLYYKCIILYDIINNNYLFINMIFFDGDSLGFSYHPIFLIIRSRILVGIFLRNIQILINCILSIIDTLNIFCALALPAINLH